MRVLIAGAAAGAMFVPLALRREPEFLAMQGVPALVFCLLLVGAWFTSLLALLGFIHDRLRDGKSEPVGLAGGILGGLVSLGLGVMALAWGQNWMTVLPVVTAGVCAGMGYGFRRELRGENLKGVSRAGTGTRNEELFQKFPDAFGFEELGFGPTPLGEVEVLVVYYDPPAIPGGPTKVTLVVDLPRSLNFSLKIRLAGAAPGVRDFERDLHVVSDNEKARMNLLQATDLRAAILKFIAAGGASAEIDSGRILTDVPGVSRAAELPGSLVGEAVVLAYQLSSRAQQLGLAT